MRRCLDALSNLPLWAAMLRAERALRVRGLSNEFSKTPICLEILFLNGVSSLPAPLVTASFEREERRGGCCCAKFETVCEKDSPPRVPIR